MIEIMSTLFGSHTCAWHTVDAVNIFLKSETSNHFIEEEIGLSKAKRIT